MICYHKGDGRMSDTIKLVTNESGDWEVLLPSSVRESLIHNNGWGGC